jgi:predicted phage terminase large subunit-like protein
VTVADGGAAARKRRNAPRDDTVVRPFPRQEEFLRSSAREVLYGGSAGGGKSQALLLSAAERIHEPTYSAIALRRTFRELEASLIERSRALYPRVGGIYNEQQKRWRWGCGAQVSFGYVEAIDDTDQYQGVEFQNVLWDELTTQKSEKPYEFMFSRLRSPHGLPGYVRAASNPGNRGHSWVFRRFAPWLWQPGIAPYPGALTEQGEIPRPRPGQILWLRRDEHGREIVTRRRWHDPRCVRCQPQEPCIMHVAVSRTFIPSRVQDNAFLAGTEYEAMLHNLPPIERARLLSGDWNIIPAAGMYFRREKFGALLAAAPTNVIARVRYWDRAATEGGGDWTVGVLMSVLDGPRFVVEHVVRAQRGPGGVEALIAQTAESDPPGTVCALEQDPGQAGKVEIFHYAQTLAGKPFLAIPPQGDKLTRARPVSAQVWVGNVGAVRGDWNAPYFGVLEAYEGDPDDVDDDIDATSGAFRVLLLEYHRLKQRRGGRVSAA